MTSDRNAIEAGRWLAQALHDRDAARLNRDHGFHEHACFLAQQSAEKALKSFLYARGQGPVLGHSTTKLATDCAVIETAFSDLADPCPRLDQLSISTRYPNGLPDNIPHDFYNDTLAADALANLDRVIERVQRFVTVPTL